MPRKKQDKPVEAIKQPRTRKPLTPDQKALHALRQKAYIQRKRIKDTTEIGQKQKEFKKLILINVEQENFRIEKGIKKVRSSAEKKAIERQEGVISTGATGTVRFFEAMAVRTQIVKEIKDGKIKSVNGMSVSEKLLQIFKLMDDLILGMESNSSFSFTLGEKTEISVFNPNSKNSDNDTEEEGVF